jgi:lipopolysaccharide/colanic/teichoic acid biosynthesis glycosyltransferase
MVRDAGKSGPAWTRAFDPRITALGQFMRKWKLDELPQLLNVLRGEMSMVGPRPLPIQHWQDFSGDRSASLLTLRPGITSAATLHFRNEEELLGQIAVQQTRTFYARIIIPIKQKMDAEYFSGATLSTDLMLIFKTICRIACLREEDDLRIKNLLFNACDNHGEANEQVIGLEAG